MSDSREPEVTGAPSADARSVEVEVAEAEAVAGASGPANFAFVVQSLQQIPLYTR